MPYKRGRPLLDVSLAFSIASALTFYTVWPIAMLINVMMYSSRYENKKRLRTISKAVLVSNHTTFFDPVFICGAIMPYRTWHTLLEKTVVVPYLGTLTRLLGGMPVPVGRQSIDKLIESCKIGFKHRKFIHFYPEGECYLYNQEVKPFKFGAFLVSAHLNVPIIPLATVFSAGSFKPYSLFGRSLPKEKIVVLDAMYPSDYIQRDESGEIIMESVYAFAKAAQQKIQDEIHARNGCSAFYKGKMERMKGIND